MSKASTTPYEPTPFEIPPAPVDDAPKLKAYIFDLMKKREEFEAELLMQMEYLDSTPAGQHGPLIDKEGFPRADCDVYGITVGRNRVATLRMDLQLIMDRIETSLHSLHALEKTPGRPREKKDEAAAQTPQPQQTHVPLCTVNSVAEGSPAMTAGLQAGDVVVSWGHDIAGGGVDPLQHISTVTSSSVGRGITVRVLRNAAVVELTVVPRTWSGRGVLGCHLLPANTN
eukprot:PhM_4_TR16227/c0_g1_i1/m.46223/K06693/PSMD9; 26S proteasome non-ATPase regulatory subunit 9